MGEICLLGDFNARIGCLANQGFVLMEGVEEKWCFERKSKDTQISRRGVELIRRVNSLNLLILNGVEEVCPFTCTTARGSSMIDFGIISLNLWNMYEKKSFKVCTNYNLGDQLIAWSFILSDISSSSPDLSQPSASLSTQLLS